MRGGGADALLVGLAARLRLLERRLGPALLDAGPPSRWIARRQQDLGGRMGREVRLVARVLRVVDDDV